MSRLSFVRGTFALVALAVSAQAQTLYGIDDTGTLIQFKRAPDNNCENFSASPSTVFSYTSSTFCGALLPLVSSQGDIGVDRMNDVLWVCDGFAFTEFSTASTGMRHFDLTNLQNGAGVPQPDPSPLTGLGVDAIGGLLWVTDGTSAYAIQPPAAPGCNMGQVPILVQGPIAIPLSAGSVASDIDWDSQTSSLWACDNSGAVTSFNTDGTPGPFGSLVVASVCTTTNLTGIAVDSAAAAGIVTITDGTSVTRVDMNNAGNPAATTFYAPADCQAVPEPFPPTPYVLSGLASSAHAFSFGRPTFGGVTAFLPVMGFEGGQSVVPNPAFALSFAGAHDGELALLYRSNSQTCPPFNIFGVNVYISLLPLHFVGSLMVGPTGLGTIATPLPAISVGKTVSAQYFFLDFGAGTVSSTGALAFTTAAP